ncbi:MAG: caspase family protein [Nitrospirae bacterium]|nr:caspase family protein [Nitrospirota bacterium]
MKTFKKITMPRIVLITSILFLTSCAMATAVPEIYLKQSDLKMELNKEAYGIDTMYVSKDGKYMLTGSMGDVLTGLGLSSKRASMRLWDLTEGKQLLMKPTSSERMHSVALSSDSRYSVTGGLATVHGWQSKQAAILEIWDIANSVLLKDFKDLHGSVVSSVNFSPDGRYLLATAGTDIHLIDTKTWNIVRTMSYKYQKSYFSSPYFSSPYFSSGVATFSPDGKFILSGGLDAVVRLWDVETGREIRQFHGHKKGMWGGVSAVAFTTDRYALTSGWHDDNVMLWDIKTGVEVRRFSGFESYMFTYVSGLALSPDGKHVLIEGFPLKIWDIQTGEGLTDLNYIWKGMKTASIGKAQYHPNGQHILLTWGEPAVRIFDIKTGEEIAVFIGFEDGEWLTITSEGYYNASEKGAQYLTVKMGDKDYMVESFYDVFYRPDVVTAKLRGDDISGLITITMKDAIKSPPPVVEISPIASSPTSPKAKVCYKAKSTGGGIGEIRLFHNGKLIESDGYYKETAKTSDKMQLAQINSKTIYEDMRSVKIKGIGEISPIKSKTKGEQFEACKEVDAIAGENEISITAFNKDNTVQGYMQTVKFNSTIKQEDANLYILSIGIDQYRDNSVALKYAARDAKDIGEKLMRQSATLYKPQNIHYELLADNMATKANTISKINDLSKIIKPTDSFILFVAGHGILLQNQYYMLTSEYDGNVNEGTMISSNEIVEISKKIKSLSQLFIFDTCHAGGVDYIVSGLYDARMSVLAKKMGLHIYASANSKEQAMDGYQGNGLFTYTLLDGLNNNKNADKNKDNKISLTELGEYSKQTTTDISKKIGHAQTPLIINFGKDNTVYNLR